MPEAVQPYLGFLHAHLYAMAFVVAAIDATGIPFPGRLLLVVAGALSARDGDVVAVILLAAGGALAGDHAVYLLGRLGGERLQAVYCRLTMNAAGCLAGTRVYLERFGALAIVLGRFAFTVRLVAALLAGSGAISYPRFLVLDALGALGWAALLVLLGRFLGGRAPRLLEAFGGVELVLVATAVGMAGVAAFRLWQRSRRPAASSAR